MENDMKKILNRIKPENRRATWGKYFGVKYKEIPLDYLEWYKSVASERWHNSKRLVEAELERRSKLPEKTYTIIRGEYPSFHASFTQKNK